MHKEKERERETKTQTQRERELDVKIPEQSLHFFFFCIDNSNFLQKRIGNFTLPPKMCNDIYISSHTY